MFRGLRHLADHKTGPALEQARQLSAEIGEEDFDLEAASLLVGLWIRLSRLALQLDEMMPLMSDLGLRFCTSKASSELLVAMAEDKQELVDEFRNLPHPHLRCPPRTAMRYAMRGGARQGVQLLIEQGEATRNAKLIDMASLVLKRHAEKIDDAEQLAERISDLQNRYVLPIASLSNRKRAAGGLALRQ